MGYATNPEGTGEGTGEPPEDQPRVFTLRFGGRLGAAGATNFLVPLRTPDGAGAPAVAATAEAILSMRVGDIPGLPVRGQEATQTVTVGRGLQGTLIIERARLVTSAAPGAAQTYTAQIRVNAGNVGTTIVNTGAAQVEQVTVLAIGVVAADLLAVSITSSGGAAGASDAIVELDCALA